MIRHTRRPSYLTQSTPPSRFSVEAYFTPITHARNPSGVWMMSPGANPKGAQWSTPSSWVMYAGPFFLPPFLPPFLGGMSLAAVGTPDPTRQLECGCDLGVVPLLATASQDFDTVCIAGCHYHTHSRCTDLFLSLRERNP